MNESPLSECKDSRHLESTPKKLKQEFSFRTIENTPEVSTAVIVTPVPNKGRRIWNKLMDILGLWK